MEDTIQLLEAVLKEIKQWEHEPRPQTVTDLKELAGQMYRRIFE